MLVAEELFTCFDREQSINSKCIIYFKVAKYFSIPICALMACTQAKGK